MKILRLMQLLNNCICHKSLNPLSVDGVLLLLYCLIANDLAGENSFIHLLIFSVNNVLRNDHLF